MICISENIHLQKITIKDIVVLKKLMQEIYPPAYQHYWTDKGNWYINGLYNKDQIEKELKELDTTYCFVLFKNEIVGVLRVLWNYPNDKLPNKKSAKLHRLYLHQKTHGKGLGKTLLNWVENTAKKKQCKILWLETMNEQQQAFNFYKNSGYKSFYQFDLDFPLLIDTYRGLTQVFKEI